jgi:hypothetical protein
MGGLCQTAVRRPRGRTRLSFALRPPRRHLQPASDRVRRDRRASPRNACRDTAAGACRSATITRLASTLSPLRRMHDHHRELQAMAGTTRATSRARVNREQHVLTRHGLCSPQGAIPLSRQMLPGVSSARISATGLNISRGQFPGNGARGVKSHSPGHRQRPRRGGFAIKFNEQNSKSP